MGRISLKIIVGVAAISGVLVCLCFFFRVNLLQAVGGFLISEDNPVESDVIFVLGGGSYDRGRKAAEIYAAGWGERVICTSEMVPSILKPLNISHTEAEITRLQVVAGGVPEGAVTAISRATSTREEADLILQMSMDSAWKTVMVISDRFHTARIRRVFYPGFKSKGIHLVIVGAPNSEYDENRWWEDEQGMLMVNNEYMKSLYYLLK